MMSWIFGATRLKFPQKFQFNSDNILKVMEARTYVKTENKFVFDDFLAALHWQHSEKDIMKCQKEFLISVCKLAKKFNKKLSDMQRRISALKE